MNPDVHPLNGKRVVLFTRRPDGSYQKLLRDILTVLDLYTVQIGGVQVNIDNIRAVEYIGRAVYAGSVVVVRT